MTEPDLWQQSRIQDKQEREAEQLAKMQAQKVHNDRSMLRITLASTAVAVIAALGVLRSGYEAHKARIEDERPFLAVDFKRGAFRGYGCYAHPRSCLRRAEMSPRF